MQLLGKPRKGLHQGEKAVYMARCKETQREESDYKGKEAKVQLGQALKVKR